MCVCVFYLLGMKAESQINQYDFLPRRGKVFILGVSSKNHLNF